ncbi:hypothetical protein PSCLAVI8L_130113 [Pseudoclavibacter sp. 8L]|nr:hypothetical protein PSCLAVI8L_130113 [Pseudoclavibacter sp. 8L]
MDRVHGLSGGCSSHLTIMTDFPGSRDNARLTGGSRPIRCAWVVDGYRFLHDIDRDLARIAREAPWR